MRNTSVDIYNMDQWLRCHLKTLVIYSSALHAYFVCVDALYAS